MSLTSGSFNAAVPPDLTKEAEGFTYTMVAGAGVAGVVNPSQPQQGFTAYNVSNNPVRGTITFTAGIVAAGGAATRVFLIPAGGTYSADFADEGATDSVLGAIGAIDSISLVPVALPVAAGVVEASTLAVATAASAGYVAINFASA